VRLVRELAAKADQLPRYSPRTYFSARRNPRPEPTLTLQQAKAAWAREVIGLARVGYFEDAFGSSCCDAREDPAGEGRQQLAELLRSDLPMWPLEHWAEPGRREPTGVERAWPDELFYDVVEALHDLVARPRRRTWHRYCEDWDYLDFARAPGQAVYRWRVNAVLARSEIGLRLAEAGEEAGLLVHVTDDDRDQLAARVIGVEAEQGVRAHAVAKFRGRGAGVPEKRSAIVDLAGLLENRRSLLKAELLRKDEGALFDIANNFDLRHRRTDQRGDYDEAFLDWLFWWYLGTLDLTDRLLARQAASAAAAGS